ncbi:hypothetical protein FZ103_04235 [Streptomonospora sp. PA3]|uniref:hypothetical protein n=1 Tax=Streptomonospora sp. PA3 TaxID=2607326 RepID=UPI0012DF0F29|nr:hypothetical protein [Streptomonospora sp. PA3]MUL40394.1 hypothetical protein [Streptomonospora sp. PA3]
MSESKSELKRCTARLAGAVRAYGNNHPRTEELRAEFHAVHYALAWDKMSERLGYIDSETIRETIDGLLSELDTRGESYGPL